MRQRADFTAVTAARCFALIPAGGSGNRLRSEIPKQYVPIAGVPMLRHVLDTFAAVGRITHTFVAVALEDSHIDELLVEMPRARECITLLRCGGSTRQQTVANALAAIQRSLEVAVAPADWILVHDAARPGLTVELVDKLISGIGDDTVGGLLALPVADTLKYAPRRRSAKTVERANLWAAQTPQMFRFEMLTRALQEADTVTDEASAIEALGFQPLLIEGSSQNFKVTLPDDIALATALLKGRL